MMRGAIDCAGKAVTALAVVMAVSACAVGGAKKETVDGLVISNPKGLAGKSDVIVPGFSVSFVQEDRKMAQASAGTYSNASSSTSAKMRGVSKATMQAITDFAYQDFKKKLVANGYSISDLAAIQATQNAAYQSQTFVSSPQPNTTPYLVYNNNMEELSFAPSGKKILKANNGLSYAAEGLDAAIINLNYIVHFGYIAAKSSETSGYSGSNASASTQFHPGINVAWYSGLHFLTGINNAWGNPNTHIYLNESLFSDQHFGKGSSRSSGGGYGDSFATRDISLQVDEHKYAAIAKQLLAQANDKIIGAMAARR